MHSRERTKAFALAYGDRPLRAIDALVVAEWFKDGRNMGTVPALRAMFNDARRPHAGLLIDYNPSPAWDSTVPRAGSTSSRPRPAKSPG